MGRCVLSAVTHMCHLSQLLIRVSALSSSSNIWCVALLDKSVCLVIKEIESRPDTFLIFRKLRVNGRIINSKL